MATTDCRNCGESMPVGGVCDECGHMDRNPLCDCQSCYRYEPEMYCPRCHDIVPVRTHTMGVPFTTWICRECNHEITKELRWT